MGVCPRCGKQVRLSQLYINRWMAMVLTSVREDQVVLTPDGTVKPKTHGSRQREIYDCSQTDYSTIAVKTEPGLVGPSYAADTRLSEADRIFKSEGLSLPSGGSSPPSGPPSAQFAIAEWEQPLHLGSSGQGSPSPSVRIKRLNRGLIGRQWVPMCSKCGNRCREQHDPQTGIVEEGCCGVIAPRSEWILQLVVGTVTLRLHPDDLLFVMGQGADAFGGKLMFASFFRAEQSEPLYFGYIDYFGRFELDYLIALCSASASGSAACSAVTPVPDAFRDWQPRRSTNGSRGWGMSQAPSTTQTPYAPSASFGY